MLIKLGKNKIKNDNMVLFATRNCFVQKSTQIQRHFKAQCNVNQGNDSS